MFGVVVVADQAHPLELAAHEFSRVMLGDKSAAQDPLALHLGVGDHWLPRLVHPHLHFHIEVADERIEQAMAFARLSVLRHRRHVLFPVEAFGSWLHHRAAIAIFLVVVAVIVLRHRSRRHHEGAKREPHRSCKFFLICHHNPFRILKGQRPHQASSASPQWHTAPDFAGRFHRAVSHMFAMIAREKQGNHPGGCPIPRIRRL